MIPGIIGFMNGGDTVTLSKFDIWNCRRYKSPIDYRITNSYWIVSPIDHELCPDFKKNSRAFR